MPRTTCAYISHPRIDFLLLKGRAFFEFSFPREWLLSAQDMAETAVDLESPHERDRQQCQLAAQGDTEARRWLATTALSSVEPAVRRIVGGTSGCCGLYASFHD